MAIRGPQCRGTLVFSSRYRESSRSAWRCGQDVEDWLTAEKEMRDAARSSAARRGRRAGLEVARSH